MTDTVYHAGHGVDSVIPFQVSDPWETYASFKRSHSRNCANVGQGLYLPVTLSLESLVEDASADGWWLHWFGLGETSPFTASYTVLKVFYGAFSDLALELRCASTGTLSIRLYGYETTSYTDSGNSFIIPANQIVDYDLHCYTSGGNSHADLYVFGLLACSVSRTTDSNNGLLNVQWFRGNANYEVHLSEIVVANFDTTSMIVEELYPTGAGTYSEQASGTYAAIDDVTGSDLVAVVFDSVSDRMTYTHPARAYTGATVKAVALNARASGDGTNYLKGLVYASSTDYVQAALCQDTAMVPRRVIMANDPATSSPWTGTLSSHEFGFKVESS